MSSLLAAAVVMTAGLAVFFDARAKATDDDRLAASFVFLKVELQLFLFAVDLADDTAAAAVFGTEPVLITSERSSRFSNLMVELDGLVDRDDLVGELSSELQTAITLEQVNVVGTGDLSDLSGSFVLDYYDRATALWSEFEPLTRSLVGEDRLDIVVGSQALFETRRIRRAALRNQVDQSGLSAADPEFGYLMGTDRFVEGVDPIGPQGRFQLGLRPLLEAAGVDTKVLGDQTVEQGFLAVDLSRRQNQHTPERDVLIVRATETIDQAFYGVLDSEAAKLIKASDGSRRVANASLAFVAAVGIGLIALVRYLFRISAREDDALAARELVIGRQEEFIGLVSHELRTPITSILGYSEVLNGHLDDFAREEIDEMIGIIADQSHHVSGLVDDLLTLFRADAGQLRLSVDDFCILDVVREVLLMVPESVAQTITVLYESQMGARADRSRVLQIIRNVVDNAGKYGGDRISINVKTDEDRVFVRVSDNGPGIPRDKIPTVFEAFGQLDEHGRQGSGLGLAIASRLADAMDGSLYYESDIEGAVFVLELPAVSLEPAPENVSLFTGSGRSRRL